jgi:hypothetical protein
MTPSRAGWKMLVPTLLVACLPGLTNPWLYPQEWQQVAAWAGLFTVCAVALVGRLSQGYLFALVCGLLISWHPLFFHPATNGAPSHLALALLFLTAALVLAAWHELLAKPFTWWRWVLLFAGLASAAGLAWRWDRLLGIEATLLVVISLLVLAPITYVLGKARSSWASFAVIIALGLLAPATAALLSQDANALQLESWSAPNWSLLGSKWEELLAGWFFIPWWITTPIVLWAWWRTLRRGRRQWDKGEAPLAWVLTVGSSLAFLGTIAASSAQAAFQPVPIWIILLAAFLVFDVLQAIGERLVLQPPEPRPGPT